MNSKTNKLKTGSENSVIIIILAVLLVVVLAIVGVIVAKDNKGLATFDGGKVTKSEYKIYYQMFASYLQMYGYTSDEIPLQILDRAALDKMILSDAKSAGVKITDDQKKEVDDIFNDDQYIEYFKGLGLDLDDLREIYYNDYVISNYIDKLANEASDDVISEYIKSKYGEGEEIDMNEYDTSHILFQFSKDDGTTMTDEEKAELKTKAEEVLKRALAGEDFAALAKEFSDDSTAEQGGQYIMYMDGNTVEEYANAVKSMKVGQVNAALVESAYGYHIIKLNAINENGRLKNSNERQEYANTLFDDLETNKNLKRDEDALMKFVKEIDPDAYSTTDDSSNATDSSTTQDNGTEVEVTDESTQEVQQ